MHLKLYYRLYTIHCIECCALYGILLTALMPVNCTQYLKIVESIVVFKLYYRLDTLIIHQVLHCT